MVRLMPYPVPRGRESSSGALESSVVCDGEPPVSVQPWCLRLVQVTIDDHQQLGDRLSSGSLFTQPAPPQPVA